MSIASLGIVGGLATTGRRPAPPTQNASIVKPPSNRAAAAASEHAENAAGIGQTEEDAGTTDRDADGRRLWENTRRKKAAAGTAAAESTTPPISKDPTGACGIQLDLMG